MSVLFPEAPLAVLVELLLNGTWTDVTSYAYQRDGSVDIAITYGRPDEAESMDAATCTLQLNNRGGTFSAKNTDSPFYPFLTRNTQLRVSAQTGPDAADGLGFVFFGEVSAWPPSWDTSANDVWVAITASGIGRRLNQQALIGSALSRWYLQKATDDPTYPVAYWPCEDGQNATTLNEATGQASDMTFTGVPNLASDDSFGGSDPIPVLNDSVWTGLTGSYAPAGDLVFDTPGTYSFTPPAGVSAADVIVVGAGGGGGGSTAAGGFYNGGGGGAGELGEEAALTVSTSNTYTIVVGAGGHGNAGDSGSDGADTTFSLGATILVKAQGGTRGRSSSAGTGGNYATATIHHKGGNGFYSSGTGVAGAGGSSGGRTANGVNATSGTGAAPADTYGGPGGDSGGTYTPSGGGHTTPPTGQSFVKTYACTHSYAYAGSDGTIPNSLLRTDTSPQMGGDVADTFNGKSKSWLLFDSAAIAADLVGATVTKVVLTLQANHTWFTSGGTGALGWDTTTSFPSTKADPSAHVDLIEFGCATGQVHQYSIGTAFGTAFKSSGATSLVLFKNSNSLQYYCTFNGPKQSNPPKLTIYYTK